MIQTIDALALGAIELPPDQRFALAQRILASVEPEEILETDEAWALEIRERMRGMTLVKLREFQHKRFLRNLLAI